MDITVTLTEKTQQIIRKKAFVQHRNITDFVSGLLEEKVREEFPEYVETEETDLPHPLLKFAGMFASGVIDTSERHSEILRDAVKMPGGFGGGD